MNETEQAFLDQVYDGHYVIEDDGTIWRENGTRAEKRGRYDQVQFKHKSKWCYVYVHRVVWMWSSGLPIPEGMEINHLDGDKHNNHPANLQLVTRSQNGKHAVRVLGLNRGEKHGAAKLSEQQVKRIRVLCTQGTLSRRQIGDLFGVHFSTITLIAQRKTWRHVA